MRYLLALALLSVTSLAAAQEKPDLEVVHRIKQEAFERSQVMDHLFYLVEVHGPRLTSSPGYRSAARFARDRMQQWGLNAKEETWGPYGYGWSYSRYSAHLIKPQYEALIGLPMGWTPSTQGVVSGTPIIAVYSPGTGTFEQQEAALDRFIQKYRGKLGGQIVLVKAPKELATQNTAANKRFSSADLAKTTGAPQPVAPPLVSIDYEDPNLEIPEDPDLRRAFMAKAPRWLREEQQEKTRRLKYKFDKFLVEEGVKLAVYPAAKGDGGTIFPPNAGSYRVDAPASAPSVAFTPEQYNRIYRLVEKGLKPVIEVELQAAFDKSTTDSVNVIAELPGTTKKDEVVMIGAHLDSVAAGLGATDNAAGCAVMMEAMRILKALNLKMDRTVRVALWGGEEEGLLGSEAYVKQHFADAETMKLLPGHAKLSAYYNFDNGTGKIRGIYTQGNDMVKPLFTGWLAPFSDLDAATVTIRNTGGTDHLSFDAVGLPGFQFIQDPVEYDSRTHHSNMDVYDRIQAGDLMQSAAIVASFVYHTANRPDKLPRKALPEAKPKTRPKK